MPDYETTSGGALCANGGPIANFVPQVIGIYRDIDAVAGDTGPPQAVEVMFTLKGRFVEHSVIIPYQELSKFDFEVEFPGCICSNINGRSTKNQVLRYIRVQLEGISDNAMEGLYFSTPGWHFLGSGLKCINGRQIIGGKTDKPFWVNPAISDIRLAADPREFTPDDVEKLVCAFHCAPDVMLPVWAFTVYASLRSVLHREGLPTACVLYLDGKQGVGKSETAKKLCALYDGAAKSLAHIYDARSTEAAMRNALADARDRVIILDDICNSTNPRERRRRLDLAATLVRDATNGVPITRMNGKTAESVECAASLVITGEFPLEVPSDITRCVTVTIDRQLTGGNDADRTTAASTLAGFLQWFAEHSEQELECLRTEYHSFKTKERSHREERLQISLWELSWAFSSFLRFAVSVEAISQQAAEQMDASLTVTLGRTFNTTLAKLDKLMARSFDNLAVLIHAGARSGGLRCFKHNGCLCVGTQVLTAYLRQVSDDPTLSINEVTAQLRRKGLLLMDETGKSTRKVNGIRVLTIPIKKLIDQGGNQK